MHGPGPIGDGPGRDRKELRKESQSLVKEVERAHRERCFIHFHFPFLYSPIVNEFESDTHTLTWDGRT